MKHVVVGAITIMIIISAASILIFWPKKYPDISKWQGCVDDDDCVISTNIMCADHYGSKHDACINQEYARRAKKIPSTGVCTFGVTRCGRIDGQCFATG